MQKYWEIPRLWSDQTVVIFGGGPSLPSLVDGNCFDHVRVIGVNDAFRMGEMVEICWFGDSRWYWWNKEDIDKFQGLKISGNRHPEILGSVVGQPDVNVVLMSSGYGISTKKDKINFNSSSGAAAVNLAWHLGVSRVILVGYDMRMVRMPDGTLKKNWREHPGPEKGGSALSMSFNNFIRVFGRVAEDAKKLGLEILNATPESALKIFPFVELGDVL